MTKFNPITDAEYSQEQTCPGEAALPYVATEYRADGEMTCRQLIVAVEKLLEIRINGEPFSVVMRTPGKDVELIRGLLYTEDIWQQTSDSFLMENIESRGGSDIINVCIPDLDPYRWKKNSRSLISATSCGICGKQTHPILNSVPAFSRMEEMPDLHKIMKMFLELEKAQWLFHSSGGTHAAAGFDSSGKPLSLMEDVGRHNAVDKVIGDLLNRQELAVCRYLLLSGRASFEIVSKCFIAGIRVLAVVSAPTTLAIDFARELGITLIGFCRENRMTVYHQPT